MRIASSSRRVPTRIRVGGVLRRLERHCDVALRGQVIDLIRLHFLDDADEIGRIRQISVMQAQPDIALMRILVEMIDAVRIERGRAALDAVNLVALAEQQLSQVGAVLAGDPRDECPLRHV